MSPREKATYLVDRFKMYTYDGTSSSYDNGIEISLIHANEMIEEYEGQIFRRGLKNITTESLHGYWIEVKHELEKL